MRFHCLGLPHTITSKDYNACAFTQKVLKFCKMMSGRGHEIIHYGHELSDPICDEHVTVVSNDMWKKFYGAFEFHHRQRKGADMDELVKTHKDAWFEFDTEDECHTEWYNNAIREIKKRKKKNDFLLCFWGNGVFKVADAFKDDDDIIVVEPGIGYAATFADYRVFESYALYHADFGVEKTSVANRNNWYDIVIPNYFDLDEFEYSEDKEDYFLFLGRVYTGKGIHIAEQICEALGKKLIVAGQIGDEKYVPKECSEWVGYADVETRKKLMSKAQCTIIASTYVEPFGGVQIESLLSGTPTITTDWGAFAENNINGLTGYRCRTFNDFIWAAENIDRIKPKDCRKFGEKFSLENIAPLYEKYFKDILDTYNSDEGWYKIRDEIPANLMRNLQL